MKKLILTSIFILSFSFIALAQTENPPCPEMSIKNSENNIFAGDTVFFSGVNQFKGL